MSKGVILELPKMLKLLSQGKNPFESSLTRVYAPLKVRPRRIRAFRKQARVKK